jgi:excisionase family DNA binding protein
MDDLLTTQQAADRLGLKGSSRVRQLILEGKLPAAKVGRDLLIKASDLVLVMNRPKAGRPSTKAAKLASRRPVKDRKPGRPRKKPPEATQKSATKKKR